jgi:hypothetical protein
MTALYVQESVGTKLPESTRSRAQHTRVSIVYGELRLFSAGIVRGCDFKHIWQRLCTSIIESISGHKRFRKHLTIQHHTRFSLCVCVRFLATGFEACLGQVLCMSSAFTGAHTRHAEHQRF